MKIFLNPDFSFKVIPLMWALMERKSESAYVAVLSLLRVHLRFWSFQKVICDFEDAVINAFETVFNVNVQGCFFHSVNVWFYLIFF